MAYATGRYMAVEHFSQAYEVDEVVAMVQKAVAAIKSEGAEKGYTEFEDNSGTIAVHLDGLDRDAAPVLTVAVTRTAAPRRQRPAPARPPAPW